MNPALRSVGRGLRLVALAYPVTVAALLTPVLMTLAIIPEAASDFLRQNWWVGALYGWALFGALVVAFCGMVIGWAGKTQCLRTPTALRMARIRGRLAVVFEGCGLFGQIGNVGMFTATSVNWVPLSPWIVLGTTIVSVILHVAGRVMFLGHLRSLAHHLADRELKRLCSRSLFLFVAPGLAGAVWFCLLVLFLTDPSLSSMWSGWLSAILHWSMTGLVTVLILAGAWVYARLLQKTAKRLLNLPSDFSEDDA
ncbi:MAG: hypothetical protein MUF18_14315 [Fimbriiglobus sp.]|jgi:hypothetical protein|nr:hypothetical protein [Fimbriiglobus sp.]